MAMNELRIAAQEHLGTYVTDKVTGLSGYVINVIQYSTGMMRFDVQPKGDGKTIPQGYEFDLNRLERTKEEECITPALQFVEEHPPLTKVKSRVSGLEGTIRDVCYSLNGCCGYTIAAKDGDKHALFTLLHEDAVVVTPVTPATAPSPVKKTGSRTTFSMIRI